MFVGIYSTRAILAVHTFTGNNEMEIGAYEAAQREKARALKRKFYAHTKKKPQLRLVEVAKPEWKTKDCWFSEHVDVYRKRKAFEASVRSFCIKQNINLESFQITTNRRTLKAICDEVLVDFEGVTLAEVQGVRRSRKVVAARHACIKAVYDEREDLSSPVIGRFFRRDHTVVLYAAGKLSARKSKAGHNYEVSK